MVDRRISMRDIGPYYRIELELEAFLTKRSVSEAASSLLCSRLQQREDRRAHMLSIVADVLGIDVKELRQRVLSGEKIELPEQVKAYQDDESEG